MAGGKQEEKVEEDELAKHNRWGSLAARLEVQCNDMTTSSPKQLLLPPTSTCNYETIVQQQQQQESLFGQSSAQIRGNASTVTASDNLRSSQLPISADADSVAAATSKLTTIFLKDWIITKKVNRDINEAATSTSSTTSSTNMGMSQFEKERIYQCVQIAQLLGKSRFFQVVGIVPPELQLCTHLSSLIPSHHRNFSIALI